MRYAGYRRELQKWWGEAQSWEPTRGVAAKRAVEDGYGSAFDIAEVQPKWLAECRAHVEAGVIKLVEREERTSRPNTFNFTRALAFPPDQPLPSDVAKRLQLKGHDSDRWFWSRVDPDWWQREDAEKLERDRMEAEYIHGLRAVVGWNEGIELRREIWIKKDGVWRLSPKIIKASKSTGWYDNMERFKAVALEIDRWMFPANP